MEYWALTQHSFLKDAISASTPFSNHNQTNIKLEMTKNDNKKIKQENDGLEYSCPKRSLVKPVIEDLLAEKKSSRELDYGFDIGGRVCTQPGEAMKKRFDEGNGTRSRARNM